MNVRIGSTVKALIAGRPEMVEITHIYTDLEPQRFEADKVIRKDDDWKYPEGGDKSVWGYISDILEIIQH